MDFNPALCIGVEEAAEFFPIFFKDWQQVEILIKGEPGTFTLTLAVIEGEGIEVAKITLWDD